MHGKSCYLTSTLALFSPTSKVSKFCLELEEVPKMSYLSPLKKKKKTRAPTVAQRDQWSLGSHWDEGSNPTGTVD